MSTIIRIIYGLEPTDKGHCKRVISIFSKFDSLLCPNYRFRYLCISNIESLSKSSLLSKARNFSASFIIFNSIYTYSCPPNISNNWPLYVYQPILFEASNSLDHTPTLLPINRINQNTLLDYSQKNLLSFAIDVKFLQELSDKLGKDESGKFDVLKFLVNNDMGLWSNLESHANRELCMIPIDLGYDNLMSYNTNLSRKDRCPLKVKSLVDNSFQNLSLPIYLQIPSIRFVLTSDQTNIYTSPFFPDLLYIRISTSKPDDSLSLSTHLTNFGIDPSNFPLLSKLISCLQVKY